jgi:hypothetical protein
MAQGPKDTNKLNVVLNSFEGGESIDFKNGVASSFYQSEAFDFRSKASQMSVLPGLTALSGASAVLVDLPVDMVQDPTGVRWIIGDQGNLYKLATNDVLTKVATTTETSGYGIVYNQLSDFLYITGQQSVSMYGPLSSSPALKDAQFAKSASSANGVVNLYDPTTTSYSGSARNNMLTLATTTGVTATSQVTTNTTTLTYTTPTSIPAETVLTGKCAFAPDLEPFYSIAIYVDTVGTGNVTLTLHDGFNRSLAAITILHAALTTGYNEFVFAAPGIRSFTGAIQSGLSAAYHWHVTSTIADTKVRTLTTVDLSTADMILFNYRMVKTNNGWHPATIFTGNGFLLCIGNGQYLSTYNFANDANPSNFVYQRERFPIDAGYEICGLSVNNQYLVIAAEKRSSSTAHAYQEGALYFWDGLNPTYNFKIQIPMGAPYSVYTFNNITYFIAAGALYAWGGGQQVIKVRPIAYQNTDYLGTTDTTIVNPHMMAPRYNLLMCGYPSVTTNTSLKYGIYSWGSVELIYPNSFGYSYAMSHATYNYSAANNLQIGMIMNFVDTMYVASRKTVTGTTTYYLDTVNNSSTPAATFNWSSLIYDGGVRYKQKQLMRYKVNFLPWPANATLTVWYALERGSRVTADPITSTAYSPATGDTSIVIDIAPGRFYEAQWGFTGTCSNPALPPTITGVTAEVDPLQSEIDLRVDDQLEGS